MSEVRKLPEITRRDVQDLVARVGDGTIPSADIYLAYQEMMAEQGREPVSKRMLGKALRDARQRPEMRYTGGTSVRCWVIRKSGLEWLYPDDDPNAYS